MSKSGIAPKIREEIDRLDERIDGVNGSGTAGEQGLQGEQGPAGADGAGVADIQLIVDDEGKVTTGKWKDTAGSEHDIVIETE